MRGDFLASDGGGRMARKTVLVFGVALIGSFFGQGDAVAATTPLTLTCSNTITIPGTYVVQTSTPSNCTTATIIAVDVSDVTLDLNGRTVFGSSTSGQTCIDVPTASINVIIENGAVESC